MYKFEKLTVWQKSMDFCELIYQETKKFPREEIFGLTSQLRRAVTSIPLNIAEGCACNSKREFKHFLAIARCSQYEVATILRLAKRIKYFSNDEFINLGSLLDEIGRLLQGFINSLN